MKNKVRILPSLYCVLLAILLFSPLYSVAQSPVTLDGKVLVLTKELEQQISDKIEQKANFLELNYFF